MLKVATMFSGGLAAPEFGLKYLNISHEVVFACEWDKFARQQYLQFHGNPEFFYEDVSKFDGIKHRNEIDLLIWGSSCQNFSMAGNRKGLDGDKSKYFIDGLNRQKEIMPKIFIFENVKGMLSSNNGKDFEYAIKEFKDMGYYIKYKVLNTKDYGIPHNRERIFVLGFLDKKEWLKFEFPKKEKLTKSLKDILESSVDEKYYLSDKFVNGMIKHSEKHKEKGNGFQFSPKTAQESNTINCLTTVTKDNIVLENKELKLNQIGNIDCRYESASRVYDLQLSRTLTCDGGAIHLVEDVITPTQIGNSEKFGNSTNDKGIVYCLRASEPNGVIINHRLRRLTPIECYRLQGLKDEDIDIVVSDSQSYKITGNAISVNVMEKLLYNLYQKENKITLHEKMSLF